MATHRRLQRRSCGAILARGRDCSGGERRCDELPRHCVRRGVEGQRGTLRGCGGRGDRGVGLGCRRGRCATPDHAHRRPRAHGCGVGGGADCARAALPRRRPRHPRRPTLRVRRVRGGLRGGVRPTRLPALEVCVRPPRVPTRTARKGAGGEALPLRRSVRAGAIAEGGGESRARHTRRRCRWLLSTIHLWLALMRACGGENA
mmetsp:Transcript_15215/g.49940  ORF Transcript_15215/g.49940 Transcript_15215/m.49940 type:complete len:203 (-) Transcript_15215:1389-1997(-)